MTEVYDEIERKMGISTYASPDVEGFAAVLKARYSDFIVHEVGLDGRIARLESMNNEMCQENPDDREECGTKRKGDDEIAEDENKKARLENGPIKNEKENINWAADAKEKLSAFVGEEPASGAIDMLEYWEDIKRKKESGGSGDVDFPPPSGINDDKKSFTLPLFEDKEVRKSIHMLIRSDLFSSIALADTVDKKVRLWHILFAKQMPTYGNFDSGRKNNSNANRNGGGGRKKNKWPKDRPDYLSFVLYKENIDTTTALKDISRTARVGRTQHNKKWNNKGAGGGGIGYSGMKDKRGVTSQFCTVYRKTPEDLMILNRENKYKNSSGGGGSSRGGSSIIRVGNFIYVEKDLRLGMLKGNRFDIVLRNICVDYTNDDKDDVEMAKERLKVTVEKTKKAVQTLNEIGFINHFGMQRFGKFYDTHTVGICILKNDFEKACDIIMRPKDGETEDFKILRKQWYNRFEGMDMEDDKAVAQKERDTAKTLRKKLGRFMNCELSIVNHLCDKPRDYKGAFQNITRTMKSMFVHAYQSYIWNRAASYRIEVGGNKDVIIGDLVLVSDESSKDHAQNNNGPSRKVKCITEEDVNSGKYRIDDVVLPLIGPKIQYPENDVGAFYDRILSEEQISKDSFAEIKDRNLVIGGDYRKVMCKPEIDFHIKVYNEPKQPLIETDLMKIKNDSLDCIQIDGSDINKDKMRKEHIIGGVIALTLPSSAYATIALRELMKRPTIQNYQSGLLLEGNAEGNIIKKDTDDQSN